MPLYRYRCKECGNITQILKGVGKGKEELKCEACGSTNLMKLLPESLSIKSSENKTSQCCGITNPCDNPKRCCNR